MLDWPLLTILVCTYDRPRELRLTLEALDKHLIYPRERLQYVICDDHSPSLEARACLHEIAADPRFEVVRTPQERSGWGTNVNNGLAHVQTDYVYFTEDDYVVTRPLDLARGVATMEALPRLGYIRYRGTAGDSGLYFRQGEADISTLYPHYQFGYSLEGKTPYLHLLPQSESLWVYTHGPHLKHRRFHDFYGSYPEGYALGLTEEKFAHVVLDHLRAQPQRAPQLAIFPDWIEMQFDHIGQSYQHTPLDVT